MEAFFDPEAAAGVRAGYEFRVGEHIFHVRVDDGTVDAGHGPAEHPDAVIETDEDVFAALADGRSSLADQIASGAASASGDQDALRRLGALFRRPSPAERVPGQGA
jgi:alkyl sulfatase BDS1-like metallo-beta-lactamase superfamily hydrolase